MMSTSPGQGMPPEGLRRRAGAATNPSSGKTPEQSMAHGHRKRNELSERSSLDVARSRGWKMLFILCHILAIAMFVMGFIWRMDLHNGDECTMTYSYRQFRQVHVPPAKVINPLQKWYKLYKFMDQRDPRYQQVLNSPEPLHGSTHCGGGSDDEGIRAPIHIVLYIPGHWGSYMQSRSLGAHGLQWTLAGGRERSRHIQAALHSHRWHGNATSNLEEFVYEVYSVDFHEQGGALHGDFLEAQVEFVARSVMLLVGVCQVNRISVVGHSMGGYVARLAMVKYPELQTHVKTIVTLATPHRNPGYSFDKSVHKVHELLMDTKLADDVLTLGIMGGIKDEMISPEDGTGVDYVASSTQLMATGSLGMDHQAIVWCHEVLEIVRKVIWNADIRLPTAQLHDRALGFPSDDEYHVALEAMESSYSNSYGLLRTTCMTAAMVYNLPMLASMYGVNGMLHLARSGVVVPLLCIFLGLVFSDLPASTVLIHAFVANAIHVLIQQLVLSLCGCIASRSTSTLVLASGSISLLFALAACLVFDSIIGWGLSVAQTIAFVGLSAWTLALPLFLCARRGQSTTGRRATSSIFAIMLVTIPCLLAGKLVLLGWQGMPTVESWSFLSLISVSVFLSSFITSVEHHRGHQSLRCRTHSLTAAAILLSGYVFNNGSGYRLSGIIYTIAAVNAFSMLLTKMGHAREKAS